MTIEVFDLVRRVLSAMVAVAFLATPAAARAPDHRADHHCRHQTDAGHSGHGAAPAGCEHSDPCRDCATPACHTSSHCGATAAGIPVSGDGPAATAPGGRLPSLSTTTLHSVTTSPPTRPPLGGR